MKDKITISCHKSNLSKIRAFVMQSLNSHDVRDIDAHKMVLAVDEICANLIIHSNQCNPEHQLEVLVDFRPEEMVTFTIKDKGVQFNLNSYTEPSMDEIISSRRKGGVGLLLVKRIMDKIEFTNDKNYNICKLTKKLRK